MVYKVSGTLDYLHPTTSSVTPPEKQSNQIHQQKKNKMQNQNIKNMIEWKQYHISRFHNIQI